jgi:hypothetical protein
VSDLNGESLHDWINSERKRAQKTYFSAVDDDDDENRAYYAGVIDILDILKHKLRTKQVNPFGDRTPISD